MLQGTSLAEAKASRVAQAAAGPGAGLMQHKLVPAQRPLRGPRAGPSVVDALEVEPPRGRGRARVLARAAL